MAQPTERSEMKEPDAMTRLRRQLHPPHEVQYQVTAETALAAWEADRRALAEARDWINTAVVSCAKRGCATMERRLAEAEERAEKAEEGHREAAEEAIDALQRVAEAEENHKRKLRDVIAGCGEDPDTFAFGPLQAVDNLRSRLADAEERAEKAEGLLADPAREPDWADEPSWKLLAGRYQRERDQLRERLAAYERVVEAARGLMGELNHPDYPTHTGPAGEEGEQ